MINEQTGNAIEITDNSYIEILGEGYSIRASVDDEGMVTAKLAHDAEDGRTDLDYVYDCSSIDEALTDLEQLLYVDCDEPFYIDRKVPQTLGC